MPKVDLIINGDDFGFSEEVNEAIVRSHRDGILTSCSLMVTGDAFEQAVHLAKQNKNLAVGIHLTTVMGKSVLAPQQIPSLVDDQGHFPDNPTTAGLRYFFSVPARRQLRLELRAQFEKFAATGLELSHIDSHLHMHVHPVIFEIALELGCIFKVRRMRLPLDDLGLVYRIDRRHFMKNAIPGLIFNLLCARMRRRLREQGFLFPVRVYGHFYTGRIDADIAMAMFRRMRGGINEMYFHPAKYPDGRKLSGGQQQRLNEFNTLMDKRLRDDLRRLGVNLTSYPQLS